MSDSNLTPSPAERPQTLRIPVTRLVNPPPNKPEARLIPPEEPTAEPWEEEFLDQDPADASRKGANAANGPAARQSQPIQLPRPVNTARPAYGPPAQVRPASSASSLPAFSRPIQNPSPKANPVIIETAREDPGQAGPIKENPPRGSSIQASPVPAGTVR